VYEKYPPLSCIKRYLYLSFYVLNKLINKRQHLEMGEAPGTKLNSPYMVSTLVIHSTRAWGRQRGTGSSTPAGSGSPSGEHACAKGLSFRHPMAKVTSGDVAVSVVPVEPT
jgi:hypothetical protein